MSGEAEKFPFDEGAFGSCYDQKTGLCREAQPGFRGSKKPPTAKTKIKNGKMIAMAAAKTE